eukprot:3365164-Pyramimonas_sp.AAC.1
MSTKRKNVEGELGGRERKTEREKGKSTGGSVSVGSSDFASALDQLGPARITSAPTWPVRHRGKGGDRQTCN